MLVIEKEYETGLTGISSLCAGLRYVEEPLKHGTGVLPSQEIVRSCRSNPQLFPVAEVCLKHALQQS